MPWCPKCKTEYRVGFDYCTDCQTSLVEEYPSEISSKVVELSEHPTKVHSIYCIPIILSVTILAIRFVDVLLLKTSEVLGEYILVQGMGIILLLLALVYTHKKNTDIDLVKNGLFKGIILALSITIATISVSYLWEYLQTSRTGIKPILMLMAARPMSDSLEPDFAFAFIVLLGLAINAIMEEGLFRGLFFSAARTRHSFWRANITQAIMFGLWQMLWRCAEYVEYILMGNSVLDLIPGTIPYFVTGFIYGFLLGWLREKTSNLWTPIAAHFIARCIRSFLYISAGMFMYSSDGTIGNFIAVIVIALLSVLAANKNKLVGTQDGLEKLSGIPAESNKEIRATARKRYAGHAGMLLILSLLQLLPMLIIGLLLSPWSIHKTVLAVLRPVLFWGCYPLTCGCLFCFLKAYRQGEFLVREVLRFYLDKQLLFKVLQLGALPIFLSMAQSFINQIPDFAKQSFLGESFLFNLISFILYIMVLYFNLRLFMLPYIFFSDESKLTAEIIKKSIALTKGNVWRQVRLGVSVMWWSVLGLALLFGLLAATVLKGMTIYSLQLLMSAVTITALPIIPYISLSFAGLAGSLLNEDENK